MPETIGFLLLSAAGVTEIAGFTVTAGTAAIVGNVALASGAVGLSLALQPGAPPKDKPQDGQITVRQAIPPRRRNYGLVKISGPLHFSETKAGIRYQVIAINQGPIHAYLAHWLDDAEAVIDGNGNVLFRYTLGVQHYVTIYIKMGSDSETAFARLVADFPSIWTSDHKGNNITKVLLVTTQPNADDFTKVYPGGQPPVYRAVVQSTLCWDPRLVQNKDDLGTWTYTTNPVLIALDFHRHADGMGLASLDDVLFTDAAITEDWIPAANICDEAIPLKAGGVNARYQCCGGYDLNRPPKETLAAILATCDGQTYQRPDGAIGIRVGKTISPTVTIADKHILGYEGFRSGPANSLIPVNQITAKYTDVNLDFQEVDADPWEDDDAISETGKTETRDLPLQWVPFHGQARRLMKLAFYRANPEWSGRIITDLDGVRAYNERYITLQIDELGIDSSFEIVSFEFMPASMTCLIGVSSLEQAAFNWDAATEEGTAPTIPDTTSSIDTIADPTNLATSVASHAIHITWDDPTRIDEAAQAQYSLHGANSWFEASVNSTNNGAVTPALAAGTYDIQVRFTVGTTPSNWVQSLSIVVT